MDKRVSDLIDKQEIVDALMRYTRGIDRVDLELIESAFHPDAIDNHGPVKGSVRDLIAHAQKVFPTFHVSQHRISNIQIELHGDKANVESYLLAIHVINEPAVEELVFGRYIDLFERRNSEWKIANRMVVIDYSTTTPRVTSPYKDQLHYTAFARDRTDPVYTHRWK